MLQSGAIFVSELVIRFVVQAKREATIGYDRRALCCDIFGLYCALAASDRVAWQEVKKKKRTEGILEIFKIKND